MALSELLSDPQFLYLQRLLKLNPREAYGLLDYGWLLFNIGGDPTYKNKEHLAAVLHWDGPAKHLADALVKSGFLKRKGKDGYIIADHEKRLMDWGRKRLTRAEEAKQRAAADRRRPAPPGRPTDPDPGSPTRKGNIHTLDHDSLRGKDRDRPEPATKTPRTASKNPQQGAQGLAQEVLSAVQGVGVRQTRQCAPPPTQQIGTYTARDCALAAASLDRNNDHDTAVALWTARAAELSCVSGGLDYFRDLLAAIHNGQHPQLRKGTGKVYNPGAFLNSKTAAFLAARRSA
jgi:hypothetical protein